MKTILKSIMNIIWSHNHNNNQPENKSLHIEQLETRILLNASFDLIGLSALRSDPDFAGIDGSNIGVAVIDTGLDATHPLLSDAYVAGYDFVYNDYYPQDFGGHGTHVAGIVGARSNNIGVATDADLIGLKVFPDTGGGACSYDTQEALEWVYTNRNDYNIKVVNMSLGSGHYTSENQAFGIYRDEIERLEEVGITVVSAAGNSYKNNEYQNFAAPAIFSTLAVGAVWETNEGPYYSDAIDYTTGPDRVTSFSQRLSADNTIFAPGAEILSTTPYNKYDEKCGTSMASPMVAGCVALMQEASYIFGGRYLEPTEVVSIIRSTADVIFDGDDEHDNVQNTYVNYPRINIYNAISAIKDWYNNIAPPIDGQSGDPNGTIAGAYSGPKIDGSEKLSIYGTIGYDGGTVFVGDKDVDICTFEVLSPGNVIIEAKTYQDAPDDFDTVLRVFDEEGNELAYNDDISEENKFSQIEIELMSGVYYAGISGYGNTNYNPNIPGSGIFGETGNYTIEFSLQNNDPNGLISGAVPVNFNNNNEPMFYGYIGSDLGEPVGVTDVDLYEIYIPDDGLLQIDIDTPFDTEYVDSYLRIFDCNGNPLYFMDDSLAVSDDNLSLDYMSNYSEFTDSRWPDLVFEDEYDRSYYQGHITDSFLGVYVDRGDKYYIGISDYFNKDYDPTSLSNRPEIGDGGYYNLYVSFFNNDLNGTIDQADSQGITSLPFVDYIEDIGLDWNYDLNDWKDVSDLDVDLLKIKPDESGILEIDINSYSLDIEYPVDTVLYLFDSNGDYLASIDDTIDSLDPLLQYDVIADEIYYIGIAGYGNENFDPSQLGSGSPGDTGLYSLNAHILSENDYTSLTDDVIGYAGINSINEGVPIDGYLGMDNSYIRGANDVDLYLYQSTVNGTVEIYTDSFSDDSADTVLRIFDVDGNELAYNDDGSENTTDSVITYEVTKGQSYYIGINGFSQYAASYNPFTSEREVQGSQGAYTLSVEVLSESSVDVNIGNESNNTVIYTDADGSMVSVKLVNAEGIATFSGQITNVVEGRRGTEIVGDNIALEGMEIIDSNSKSSLIITSKGGEIRGSDLGGITGESLAKLIGKDINLTGNIELQCNLDLLMLNDISDNVTISANMSSIKGTILKVHDIGSDVNIDIAGQISVLQANCFVGGSLSAKGLGKIIISNGNFNVDCDAGYGDITSLTVAGNITGGISAGDINMISSKSGYISGNISSKNNIGKIFSNGDISGDISAEGTIQMLCTKSGDITGNIRAGEDISVVQGYNLDGALLSAGNNIGKAIFQGNINSSYLLAGYDIGNDCQFGQTDENGSDSWGSGDILTLIAKGQFANSYLCAGTLPETSLTKAASLDLQLPFYSNSGSVKKVMFGNVDFYDASEKFGIYTATPLRPIKIGRDMIESEGFFEIGNIA